MNANPTLRKILTELGDATHDDHIDVYLNDGGGSHAAQNGSYVQVDPTVPEDLDPTLDGPNELRLVADTHSHEMEHIRTSDLNAKARFAEEYPECPQAAGAVLNILEDQWVDYKRVSRFPGHKRSRALKVKLVMDNDEFTPPLGDVEGSAAYIEGFKQLAFGNRVKGFSDASEDVQEFLRDAEPLIGKARTCSSADVRERIAHDVMDLLFEHIRREEGMDDPGETTWDEARIPEDAAEEMDEQADEADEQTGGADTPDLDFEVEWPDEDDFDDDADDGSDPADADDATDEGSESGGGGDEGEDAHDATPDSAGDGDTATDDAETDSSDANPGGQGGEDGFDADDSTPDDDSDADGGGASDDRSAPDSTTDEGSESGGDDEGERERGEGVGDQGDLGDREDSVEEKYGVRHPANYNDADRRRYERYQQQKQEMDTRLGERKHERDERIDKDLTFATPHADLRSRARTSGVIREVEEQFSQYVTREQPRPQDSGMRLDRRNVVRRAAGDRGERDLYEERQKVDTGDRCIGVTLDISGSMDSDLPEAKIAMAAVAKATEVIGDDFVATCFTDDERGYVSKGSGEGPREVVNGEPSSLDLRIVNGPNEEWDWEHLDSFQAESNEPTAAGIDFTRDVMDETSASEKLMIVITDGKSYVTRDGCYDTYTDQPLEDCKQAAEDARADDIAVVGIGIGSMDESCMDQSFGADHNMLTSIDSLADDLIHLYEEQLDDDAAR